MARALRRALSHGFLGSRENEGREEIVSAKFPSKVLAKGSPHCRGSRSLLLSSLPPSATLLAVPDPDHS